MGQAHSIQDHQYQSLSDTLDKEMEKQIALKNLHFEQTQAYKKAKETESFAWEFLSAFTTIGTLIFASQKTKNRFLAVPIVPIVMYIGFRYDQCFGEHDEKIRLLADNMLDTKKHLLTINGRPITLEELDRRRANWKISN